jgi:hypothetical protein
MGRPVGQPRFMGYNVNRIRNKDDLFTSFPFSSTCKGDK